MTIVECESDKLTRKSTLTETIGSPLVKHALNKMMKYRIYCTSKFREELCIYCHLFFPLQFCNLKIYCVSVQGFCSVNLHSSFLMIQMQIFLVLTFIVLKDLHNYKGMLWAIFLNGARVPKVRQKNCF